MWSGDPKTCISALKIFSKFFSLQEYLSRKVKISGKPKSHYGGSCRLPATRVAVYRPRPVRVKESVIGTAWVSKTKDPPTATLPALESQRFKSERERLIFTVPFNSRNCSKSSEALGSRTRGSWSCVCAWWGKFSILRPLTLASLNRVRTEWKLSKLPHSTASGAAVGNLRILHLWLRALFSELLPRCNRQVFDTYFPATTGVAGWPWRHLA